LKTSVQSLSDFEDAIKSKIKLEPQIKIRLHYKENEKLFVLDDIEDLEEGMTIKVSISTQPQQDLKIEKKIDGNS